MKKTLMTLFAVMTAISMFAIKPVTLEGNFNVKKAKGAVAVYTINWDGTQCGEIDDGVFVKGSTPIAQWLKEKDEQKIADGKSEDANFVKDWESIKDECDRNFKDEWNDEFGKKGLHLSRNESEAQYRFDVVIEKLDWGSVAGSMFGWGNAGGAIIAGHADLTDINTGERVARFNINHVQGSGHPSDRFRIWIVMKQLVDEIEDIY